MTTVKYSIPNISCGHCVHTIQSEVSEIPGVQSTRNIGNAVFNSYHFVFSLTGLMNGFIQ